MASILVVEDSLDTQALVTRALDANELQFAASIGEARNLLEADHRYDLIVLDLTLPDGDGLTLGSELSSGGQPATPIIFLSARTDVRDKVAAFALGAEDYIEKPFDPLELQARVNARLRRYEVAANATPTIRVGELRIQPESMSATCAGPEGEHEIDLSPTEFRLLTCLARQVGRVSTRDHLIEQVWRDAIVGPRTIDAHVSNLRGKLLGSSIVIEPVRGAGYRLREQVAISS